MTGQEIVTEIVNILASGLTAFGSAIGSGISNAVQSMFFVGTGENQALSMYAIMVIVFGAIALAVGLTRLIFGWLGSLGN